jgi:hypothetical protein
VAPPRDDSIGAWGEAWATIHDDGSVTLATTIGGHPSGYNEYAAGNECRAEILETFTADLMALLKLASELRGAGDYELMIGIEWQGQDALIFAQAANNFMVNMLSGLPVARFSPITTTIRPDTDDEDYLSQVRDLATDLVNQAGLQHVRLLNDPAQ